MDAKRARSPRAPADGDEDKKRAGWRGAVRPEMVLVGFLITLPLLVFVFGGRWGSFPSTTTSSSSSGPNVGGRHVVAGGSGVTPQS